MSDNDVPSSGSRWEPVGPAARPAADDATAHLTTPLAQEPVQPTAPESPRRGRRRSALAAAGVGLILAGGDLVCRTLDPDGPPWRIGVEDPRRPDRLVAVVPVHTGGVATSGSARRGEHVVDARTGRPPAGVASVTVVAASLTDADIDATAAYALGRDAPAWLAARPGRSGLVVWSDGATTVVGDVGSRPLLRGAG